MVVTTDVDDRGETSWLNAEEMALWRSFLEVNGRLMDCLGSSVKAATGLSFEDHEVLVHLSEADDGRLAMSELSERLVHSQSRVTQRVDRLAARGLVSRVKCTDDRRRTYCCLTDDGRSVVDGFAPTHLQQVRHWLIDRISPDERRVLTEVFTRLATHAQAGDFPCCGPAAPGDRREGL